MPLLRDYQVEGARSMADTRAKILGDPVGIGKTRTAIHALTLAGVERATVICPAVVQRHWKREAEIVAPELKLTAVSYDKLSRQKLPPVTDTPALLVDEFHYCASPDSRRTRFIFGEDGLARRVLAAGGRVYPISGTPMPRNPAQLYPVVSRLWPKTLAAAGLDDYYKWLDHFCAWRATRYGPRVFAAKNIEDLRALLVGKMIRRTGIKLPPLRNGVVELEAHAESAALIPKLDPAVYALIERGELPSGVRESTNLAEHLHAVGDLKAAYIAEVVDNELRTGLDQVVIFARHRSVLDRLQRELTWAGVARVDGDTSLADRDEAVRNFRTIAYRVFLGQVKACGTGMDGLQYSGAREVVIAEPSWSSNDDEQAVGRVLRLGQTGPVQARYFVLTGTADDAIMRAQGREQKMRARVIVTQDVNSTESDG